MDPKLPQQPPQESAYFGLAAIAMAGVFLLKALPAFQMMFWLEMGGYKGWSDSDKKLAAYGGYIGAGVIVLLSLRGVVIGLRGTLASFRNGEPRILCSMGIILSPMSAAIWFLCGVAWHSPAYGFVKNS